MSEEKRLNDEAVEDVAGGYVPTGVEIDRQFFDELNCMPCTNRRNCHKTPGDAFMELGLAPCPDYIGPENAWHSRPKSKGV